MTITMSIDRVNSSVSDVSVPQLVQANMTHVGTEKKNDKGISESTYTIPTGDEWYPTTIVCRVTRDPKDPQGATRALIAINTFSRVEDDVLDTLVIKPINAVMTLSFQTRVEAADLAVLVGNLYGLSFNTLTSKVPDTSVLSDMMFGISKVW